MDVRRCLAVEDSPKGVASARGAGMTVIGVRTPYTSHLTLEGASIVLDSLEELTGELLEAAALDPGHPARTQHR